MAETESALRRLRQSIGASQEQLARHTKSVSLSTVKNAENGRPVKYSTAMQLLEAMNALLAEAGREPINFEDLGLNLY